MIDSLIIATTNESKKKRLTALVNEINPNIKVLKAYINSSNISREDHEGALENATQKAIHYGAYFNQNVLCEDNTIVYLGKEISPNSLDGEDISQEKVFDDWTKIISRDCYVMGSLIKAYALYKNKFIFSQRVEIKVKFRLPTEKPKSISSNALNYIMYPLDKDKCIASLTLDELNDFRKQEVYLLSQLLLN